MKVILELCFLIGAAIVGVMVFHTGNLPAVHGFWIIKMLVLLGIAFGFFTAGNQFISRILLCFFLLVLLGHALPISIGAISFSNWIQAFLFVALLSAYSFITDSSKDNHNRQWLFMAICVAVPLLMLMQLAPLLSRIHATPYFETLRNFIPISLFLLIALIGFSLFETRKLFICLGLTLAAGYVWAVI